MSIQAVSWALEQIAPMAPKFILVCLANYADENGECWPSIKTVARNAGCGERSVYRYLDELIELGLIERQEQTGKNGGRAASRYKLLRNDPTAKLAESPPCQSDRAPNWHTPYAKVGIPPMPLVAAHIDEPSIEPSITSSSQNEDASLQKNPPKEVESPTLSPGPTTVSPVDWVKRLSEAHATADGAASMANGGTCHPAALRRLCEPTVGTACDWDMDVIPAIASKAAAAKKRGKPILDWTWVAEQAIENRDRRLAGNPEVAAVPIGISRSRKETREERVARLSAKLPQEAIA